MLQLLKGARLVDPSQGIDDYKDLLIEKGRVVEVLRPGEKVADAKLIELDGLVICPGLVDIHTHLREPGFEWKETVATGSAAAVNGGFTSIACMANTDPVNDNPAVSEYIMERARAADMALVYPIGAISKNLKGEELAEIASLAEHGCVGFSDDGKPVMDSNLMRRAIEYASAFDRVVIDHPEDLNLSAEGVMNESPVSTELGLAGATAAAEEAMVSRDIILAGLTRGRVHLAHLSTKGSIDLVRRAKEEGIKITCETCPHYFSLTELIVKESGYNANTRVNPPLRGEEDKEAIIEALADGTIDAIASDHAPHNLAAKEVEFVVAASGISGIETSLGLGLKLVREKKLKLGKLIELMSANPAQIIGIEAGTLRPGAPADITVIDLDYKWTVSSKEFKSLGKNTPFEGLELTGKAVRVFVRGKQIRLD
jgi:dihydroorotase